MSSKTAVFISSTFIDLKEERQKVWDALNRFDVIVKGMEQFGARTTTPLTTCLTEVEQCDIYIAIIGMRFGSEEPDTKKSYTQLEYEKAVELNKEILIYIIDESNSTIIPSFIQFNKIDKLNSFKNLLKERHTVDTFSNGQDLVSKLQTQFRLRLPAKQESTNPDEYDNTKNILSTFFLVPKAYSGREIKLRVKFNNSPQPASRTICSYFNFEFGKTIVNNIEVIYPEIKSDNFQHIFIEYNLFDQFITLDKSKEYEILARILFKENKADSMSTNFRDKIERIYNEPYYPEDNYDHNHEPPEEYIDIIKPGDGQTTLSLKQIITGNNPIFPPPPL